MNGLVTTGLGVDNHVWVLVDHLWLATSVVAVLFSMALSILWHTSGLGAEAGRARLHEQHDWHADDNEHDQGLRNGTLSLEKIDWHDLATGQAEFLLAHGQEVVDHDGNDRGSLVDLILHEWVGGVSVHWVKPFDDDEDVHPAEETIQDDHASHDLSPEHHVVLEVKCVQALGDNTH